MAKIADSTPFAKLARLKRNPVAPMAVVVAPGPGTSPVSSGGVNAPVSATSSLLRRAVGPLVVCLVAVVMLRWTWLAWPDAMLDSGREAYLPWRITQGQMLYRDMAYTSGPLSPHLNALAMLLMGPWLRTLFIANGLVAALVLVLIYLGTRCVADRLTATLASITFLIVSCFGQLSYRACCSFMFPYSHEMIHGTLILFLLAAILRRYQLVALTAGDPATSPGFQGVQARRILIASGLFLGLLFLTKPELLIAGVLMLAVGYGLTWWVVWRGLPAGSVARRSLFVRQAGYLLLPALIPVLAAWLLLSLAMRPVEAAHGTLGSWPYLGDSRVTNMLYYRTWMGLVDPIDSLRKMGAAGVVWVGLLFPAFLLCLASRKIPSMVATMVALVYAVALFLSIEWVNSFVGLLDLVRPLPIALLGLGGIWGVRLAHASRNSAQDPSAIRLPIFMLALIALSLGMLFKLGLFARVWHYGFVLALPGVLVVVVSVIDHLPRWLKSTNRKSILFRAPAIGLLLAFLTAHPAIMAGVLAEKHVPLGDGANLFRADDRGVAMGALIDGLRQHLPPDATLAVLPEGVMINFLSHRVNPTPYTFLVPLEMTMFGENRVIESYDAHPPDFIVVTNRDTSEYGYATFGRDYGIEMGKWIKVHYAVIGRIGSPETSPASGQAAAQSATFDFLIMKRNK